MRKILFNPLTAILISLIALFFMFSLHKNTINLIEKKEQIAVEGAKNDKLKQDISLLEEELSKTEENKEKIIRDELLMQRPGEYVIKIETDFKEKEAGQKQETPRSALAEWVKLLFN